MVNDGTDGTSAPDTPASASTSSVSDKCGKSASDLSDDISEGPRQPALKTFPKTKCNKQNRAFSSFMYERFSFIEYSISHDAVFCFACRMFPSNSGNVDKVFTETGFNQWKKLSERLTKHAATSSHMESMTLWMNRKSAAETGSVIDRIIQQNDSAVNRNREVVATLARICILCGRQDLALRGHDESATTANPGIYRALVDLLRLVSESFNEFCKQLPNNANYLSKDSQNDLLTSARAVSAGSIVDEIRKAGIFSVIADDARDASCTEQTSVCVRYLLGAVVKERFLQFVDVHELDAESLSNVITTALTQNGIDITKCVAQCYDGASVMSGRLHGVQQRVRELCGTPCRLFTCTAMRTVST